MSDDLSKKRPQDASKISLKEPYEVDYWTTSLDCTEKQLKDAVDAVGHSATKVKDYLDK